VKHVALAGIIVFAVSAVACDHTTPVTPTPLPCTFTLSASSLTFGAAGGSASVTVTTAAGCAWTAASDRAWMTIAGGANGSGNGTVEISVAANTSTTERTGTLTVAGQAVAVSVASIPAESCTYDISPASATVGSDGTTGRFSVSAPASCDWSAQSQSAWLRIASGDRGSGAGTVAYAVDANGTPDARTGTIVVADRTFVVTQGGQPPVCAYSVAPVTIAACMSVPYDLTTTITTTDGCSWKAEASVASASWIAMKSTSGSGGATIHFTIADNWDAPRNGVVMITWPTPTAGQNVQIAQAGCRYAVSVPAIAMDAAGGAGTFNVYQQSDPLECGGPLQDGCLWSAQSSETWITITSPATQRGDQPVSFAVAPQAPVAAARTGVITVRDKTVTITQAGR
jgi:hypothetical protein